jgi:prevent-host-death family protein
MTRMNVDLAKSRLSELLDRVEQGEQVAITRDGKAVATLVASAKHPRRCGRGVWKGKVDMSRFDEADEEIARKFGMLDVTADHALDAARLPRHHGDPFDRLLVAQTQAEAATLVTDDAAVAAYAVPVMPARA